jgi:hypothetical protein
MVSLLFNMYTGCFKIHEFRIQSMAGKDPVELEKYLEKKIALPEEDISTLIVVQYIAATVTKYYSCYVAVPFLRKI